MLLKGHTIHYNKIGNIYHLALLFDKRFLCVTNEKSLAKKCIWYSPKKNSSICFAQSI